MVNMTKTRLVDYIEFSYEDTHEMLFPPAPAPIVRESSGDISKDLKKRPRFSRSYVTFQRQEVTAPDGEILVGERRNVSERVIIPQRVRYKWPKVDRDEIFGGLHERDSYNV